MEHVSMFVRCGLTDRRDPLFVAQAGEPDSSDIKKSNTTEWGHARITKTQAHTHNPAAVCKNFSVSACVCWQRQTVMLLPAAQPLEGKSQTLHPIYSNTARHQKALSPQQHPCWCLPEF